MQLDRQGRSRRRFTRAALAAGVWLPGGMAGLIAQALAQGEPKQGVLRLRGSVQVNGVAAVKATPVEPGDVVTTGSNSFVVFVVGRDAFLLRSNSRLEIAGGGGFADLLRLVTGKLLSVYAKGRPREIAGVTATIGIRGTGAYMETDADRTYFCLCYGEAEIVPNAAPDQKETVRTIHHDQPRFIYPAGRARAIERAPVINHRDAELILLETLVGRVPPFVDSDEYRSGVRY
jgi:hypothetical protein